MKETEAKLRTIIPSRTSSRLFRLPQPLFLPPSVSPFFTISLSLSLSLSLFPLHSFLFPCLFLSVTQSLSFFVFSTSLPPSLLHQYSPSLSLSPFFSLRDSLIVLFVLLGISPRFLYFSIFPFHFLFSPRCKPNIPPL